MGAIELTKHSVRALLPPRPPAAHKGVFGHVFVIAGSRGFTGAAKMAGLAAARSGAGLVTLGVPRSLRDAVAMGAMELMTLPLPSNRAESLSAEALRPALTFAQDKSAVAIGPGLSQNPGTQTFVRAFIARCAPPMVIDADALNALAGHAALLKNTTSCSILTPHPGEMARLCACSVAEVQKDREGIAERFARKHRCVVVLKGHRSVVAGRDGEVFVNQTGNAGMATGGTGDVLTGILGGLLAQGLRPIDAARLGVYAHGLAGDLAAAEKTERGMIAGDVIDKLPAAWRYLEGAFEP
jgi:NAD(P)H-hydrate epimerase